MADRIGGLRTILAGSACQAVAIIAFSQTQDEAGLFAISAAFGFGFAGIIPAYSVAIRDLFPSAEASWRMPLTLFTAMSGMAAGSWFAGLLYDHFGYYLPAFVTGVVFNVANLLIVGFLVVRLARGPGVRVSIPRRLKATAGRLVETSGRSKVARSPWMSGGRGA